MQASGAPRKGHYLGTVVDGKWWKRYRRDGMFARGSGEWWLVDGELHFRRFLTKRPLVLPLDRIRSVETGTWHAGQWAGGRAVLKLTWEHEGRLLTAGFVLAGTAEETRQLFERLQQVRRSNS